MKKKVSLLLASICMMIGMAVKPSMILAQGGGTVNQYSDTEVGGLTLSDWEYTETSDKITLTQYKGDQVNVVIPSEFEERPGVSVEIATFTDMFDRGKLVSLKVGTSEKKVTLATIGLQESFTFYINLVSADLSGLDTSNVVDMYKMFEGCFALKSLDLSGFDTSKVRFMRDMFSSCVALESLDLSSFNTSLVVDMSGMFQSCSALKSLNLSNFNTSNVENMYNMFNFCSALESVDLSSFDTSKVVNMHAMFSDCTALQKLDIGNFVANEWVSVSEMFYNCEKLSIINLSGFNTIGHNNFDMMFGFDKQLDHTIPTLIITSNQRIINDVVTDDVMMAYRTPYYTEAKVIYNSNHEVFDDGNTTIEKTIHQSDCFVYSTMEEVKQEFTFDATTILKDSPKITDKEGFISTWYLDEACTMPFDETGSVDFTTLTNGTLQLYAGYKEVTPEEKPAEPEDTPDTPKEEIKEPESKIEEVKKEQTSAVNTGNEVSKGMYYMLLGGSVIVLGAMAYKCRKSEL